MRNLVDLVGISAFLSAAAMTNMKNFAFLQNIEEIFIELEFYEESEESISNIFILLKELEFSSEIILKKIFPILVERQENFTYLQVCID